VAGEEERRTFHRLDNAFYGREEKKNCSEFWKVDMSFLDVSNKMFRNINSREHRRQD
jgi:hypothetical protein